MSFEQNEIKPAASLRAPRCASQSDQVVEQKAQGRVLTPRADVIEDGEGIFLTLDVPGVVEEQLEVIMDRGVLSISAATAVTSPEGVELRHGELEQGTYKRSFSLSDELDGEKVEAELKNGVLSIRIPKAERVKPRKVVVRGTTH